MIPHSWPCHWCHNSKHKLQPLLLPTAALSSCSDKLTSPSVLSKTCATQQCLSLAQQNHLLCPTSPTHLTRGTSPPRPWSTASISFQASSNIARALAKFVRALSVLSFSSHTLSLPSCCERYGFFDLAFVPSKILWSSRPWSCGASSTNSLSPRFLKSSFASRLHSPLCIPLVTLLCPCYLSANLSRPYQNGFFLLLLLHPPSEKPLPATCFQGRGSLQKCCSALLAKNGCDVFQIQSVIIPTQTTREILPTTHNAIR